MDNFAKVVDLILAIFHIMIMKNAFERLFAIN